MNLNKCWQFFIITLFLVGCGSTQDSTVVSKKTNKKNGCGVTSGSFLGGWFDYYERGLSFADCAMWAEAQADLEKAVNIRDQDKRRVYTLGMHFITNYFPNRELGIVLYQQGKFAQAEEYLLRSLSQFPSTKAEVYLNKSRIKLPLYQLNEKTSPNIEEVGSDPEWSNALGRRLQLRVSDDTFVDKVWIDGKEVIWQDTKIIDKTPISIKSAKPMVNVDINIQSTAKKLTIEARDIFGNSAKKVIVNHIDIEPPSFVITNVDVNSFDEMIVMGYIEDNGSGLKSLDINRQKIALKNKSRYDFELVEPSKTITVSALDIAGNKLDLVKPIQMQTPFNLELTDNTLLTTQQEVWLFSAWLESDSELANIVINGDNIDLQGQLRQISRTLPLSLGNNHINVDAYNADGEKLQKHWQIERQLPYQLEFEHRLLMAVFPFSCDLDTGMSCTDSNALFSEFDNELRIKNRFRLVERANLSDQLDSLKLCELMVTEECAWKVAQLIKTQTMFVGEMLKRKSPVLTSTEVYVRVIDATTGAVLTAFDAFQETEEDESIKNQLLVKLQQRFPLITSENVAFQGSNIEVEFEPNAALWKNMPVKLFDQQNSCGQGVIKKLNVNNSTVIKWSGDCEVNNIQQVTTM